jgi:hypothetical protein
MFFEFDLDEGLNIIEVRSSDNYINFPIGNEFPEGRMFMKGVKTFRESYSSKDVPRDGLTDFPWWSERFELTTKYGADTNELRFGVEARDELEAFIKLKAWLKANGE